MMSDDEKKAYVQRGFGYLNSKDLDSFFGLYDDNCRYPALTAMGLPPTKEGFMNWVQNFYNAFTNPRFEPQDVVVGDNKAMFRWNFSGTHTGELNGIRPTNTAVQVMNFTSLLIDDNDMVIEQWDLGDMLSLMTQIGAIPAPATAPA